jgi:hypothetical protein
MIKPRRSLLVSLLAVLVLLAALLVPTTAHAVEVPEGTTEVRIPLVLSTTGGAVAGAEIEFVYSEGLVYKGYQPANGLENPVGTQVDGKTYAGFFATDNRFEPTGNRIAFGNLVFEYSGSEAENITITEIDLHRVKSSGGVDSQRTASSAVIPVARAQSGGVPNPGTGTDPDTGTDPGSNSNPGGDPNSGTDSGSGTNTNPIYPGAPAGTGSPGTTVVPVSVQVGDSGTETEPVELSADNGTARTPGSGEDVEIPGAAAPLADSGASVGGNSLTKLPLLALLGLVLTVLALVILIKRRREAADGAQDDGPLQRHRRY